ncbi:MAG TPA: hypothetical protein VGD45_27720 [Steroidobacter sp.]|uniref:hypothetical protein n=1 Tax=Steroidobacter sp. TaxID=1978227 RepID=UPI002EDA90B0
MSNKTRLLAGVEVPETPIVSAAIDLAQRHCDPYLFNHSMRSWLFAVVLASQRNEAYDPEVLAVSVVLHDIGLSDAFNGPRRFEVEAADAVRAFAQERGMTQRQLQLIWDGVALNSTPSICLYKETEVSLCTRGIGADWGGFGYENIPPRLAQSILEAYPRLRMKQRFAADVCGLIRSRPQTTYDNFARDFGERFVPGYQPPSMVDVLMNAPFEE